MRVVGRMVGLTRAVAAGLFAARRRAGMTAA
jgi:hypothetical protein